MDTHKTGISFRPALFPLLVKILYRSSIFQFIVFNITWFRLPVQYLAYLIRLFFGPYFMFYVCCETMLSMLTKYILCSSSDYLRGKTPMVRPFLLIIFLERSPENANTHL